MIWCGRHFNVSIDRFWCNFSYQKHHMISYWHKKKQSKNPSHDRFWYEKTIKKSNQKRSQKISKWCPHHMTSIHMFRCNNMKHLKNILCSAPLCICVKIFITMAGESNSMWLQSGTEQSTLLMCFVDSARSIIYVSPFPPSSLNFQNKFYIS